MGPPNIVVGIDLGYTHTGVAYSLVNSGQIQEPKTISSWPGRKNKVIRKVPTRLSYVSNHKGPRFWGFQRPKPRQERETEVGEYFKLSLDPDLLPDQDYEERDDREDEDGGGDDEDDDEDDEESNDDQQNREMKRVKRLFTDFLRALRIWIEEKLQEECPSTPLASATIEYVFSVPTTWPLEVSSSYRELIKEAGYSSKRGHKAKIGLTEADAAAVYTSLYHTKEGVKVPTKFCQGDVLLVCDAGGGTTDVSILKVDSFRDSIPQLVQLHFAEGVTAGSVKIDEAFKRLVRSRLQHIDGLTRENLERIVSKTTRAFQGIKHGFGEPEIDLLPKISIEIPVVDQHRNYNEARVEGGKMMFDRSEIENLFNEQVAVILKHINKQLNHLQEDCPEDRVKYLVLSGGLGSSAYVFQEIKKNLTSNRQNDHSCDIELLVSSDPQLVVCRGLVLNQLQEYLEISVISGIRSREAYGITYDEPWDGDPLTESRRVKHADHKYYLPGKIQWVLRKNESLRRDMPVMASFTRAVSRRRPEGPVRHNLVRFSGYGILPDRVEPGRTEAVCTVDCDLGPAVLTKIRPGVLKYFHSRYHKVGYEICVSPGPAHLQIEVFVAGEKSRCGEVNVNWESDVMILGEEKPEGLDSAEDDSDSDSD